MLERLILVIVAGAVFAAAFYAFRYWHVRRMQPAHAGATSPTLLYFRGDHCAVCPAQARAIEQFASRHGSELHIETIDAERDAETAARYNIFTLPTTIWLDGDGRVRHVNYGLTDAGKLARQAAEMAARSQTADHRPQPVHEPLSGGSIPSAVASHQTNILDKGLL